MTSSETDKRGKRYTDLQKDAVFNVWAFEAERNVERTIREIVEDEICRDLEVSDLTSRTLRSWITDGNWNKRANDALFADAPGLRFRTQTALILGAPEAAEFMRLLMHLDESLATDAPIFDKETGEVTGTYKEFNDKLLKLRKDAGQVILDRTGFSPIGAREIGMVDAPPELQTDLLKSIGEITDEDALRQIEAAVRQSQGMGRNTG